MSVLLPQHMRLKAQLNEVLESELIEQKLENDAFDIYYYSNYIINIMQMMAKLCSPARDERIAIMTGASLGLLLNSGFRG